MATTTNFGWETPDDTDLVKDGALAMRTLGNAIDASLVDLKGGTTNQVLAKNSNTDMDFKWVTDATGISATIFDAKGDIIAATAADTADRLAVGANGTVLTADSATATGLKWAAVAADPTVASATISTSQTTSSTSYTDLATTGASVTLTTGTKALVIITCAKFGNNSGTREAYASFAVSGASSISADDSRAIAIGGGTDLIAGSSGVFYLDNLTAGSNTFTMKYRVYGGTVTFAHRSITVMKVA